MRWSNLVFVLAVLGSSSAASAQTSDTAAPPPDGAPSQGATTSGQPAGQPAPAPAAQPAPPPTPAGESEREREARREEEEGRRSDILWIEGQFGYSYVDLVQFSQDNFLPEIDRLKGSGYTAGLGAGFRVSFLAIGGRASLSSYPDFDVWTLGLDVQVRLGIGSVEPYGRVGVGYGWVGDANYDTPGDSTVDVFGLIADAGAGVDIYLDRIFAIGVGFDGVFLNLSRQRVDMTGCATTSCMIDTVNFEQDGDAVGLQLRLHGHASLHF